MRTWSRYPRTCPGYPLTSDGRPFQPHQHAPGQKPENACPLPCSETGEEQPCAGCFAVGGACCNFGEGSEECQA
jgi:hypothetical protein